jgi:hypothetical protein
MQTINGLDLKDSWTEITLSQYADIKGILTSPNYDEFEKELRVLAVLAGKEDFTIFDTWNRIDAHKLFAAQEFLYKEPDTQVKPYYSIGGSTYKLINHFDDLECWQFIDLCNVLKDPKAAENRLHELCAMFLRKVAPLTTKQAKNNLFIDRLSGSDHGKALVDKWNLQYQEPDLVAFSGELTRETAENIFTNLSFADAHAISVFFCLLSTELYKTAQDFLESKHKKQLKSVLKTLNETPNQKVKTMARELEDSLKLMDGL